MTKRKLAWAAIVAALIFAISGICWTLFAKHKIALSQQEVQQKIDATLPLVIRRGVSVSKVQLDFSGGKIGVAVEASATRLGQELTVAAEPSLPIYRSCTSPR